MCVPCVLLNISKLSSSIIIWMWFKNVLLMQLDDQFIVMTFIVFLKQISLIKIRENFATAPCDFHVTLKHCPTYTNLSWILFWIIFFWCPHLLEPTQECRLQGNQNLCQASFWVKSRFKVKLKCLQLADLLPNMKEWIMQYRVPGKDVDTKKVKSKQVAEAFTLTWKVYTTISKNYQWVPRVEGTLLKLSQQQCRQLFKLLFLLLSKRLRRRV